MSLSSLCGKCHYEEDFFMQKRKGKIEEEDNRPASRWGNKAFFKRFSNLTLTALLIALTIVFTRFLAIQMLTVRISLEFIPIALTSVLFGPIVGAVSAAIADVLGMLAFPTGGPYFPGFTVSTALYAFIYGLFLYNRPFKLKTVMLCVLTNVLIVDFVLVSVWLRILWQMPYEALVVTRVIKCVILYPVQVLVLYYGINAIKKRVRMYSD
jgi:ECF transporter S component (folate family)